MIQKIPVVGHDEHRPPEALEIFLQPLDGIHVQMVGRLVQQQQIRSGEHQPGQIDPGLLPAGKAHKGPLLHFRVNVQTGAHPVVGDLLVVAAAQLIGGLQLAVALQIHRPPRRHIRLHGLHLGGHILQPDKGLPEHLTDGQRRIIDRQLLQKPQARALCDGDRSALIVLLPRQDLQQGGLAAAVGADDAGPFSGKQVKGEPLQNMVLSKVFV